MIVACHPPLYLPWPGLFQKMKRADLLVLLDHTPLPMGRSFVSRNRLKNARGAFWLTVPLQRSGRAAQPIGSFQIDSEQDWRRKHLESIAQAYARAPYLADHLPVLQQLLRQPWKRLLDLNLALIKHLCSSLRLTTPLALSSQLGAHATGTTLVMELCRLLQADAFLVATPGRKFLDEARLATAGIELRTFALRAPVYPQLWGDFVPNLSVLDALLCCGPKAIDFAL